MKLKEKRIAASELQFDRQNPRLIEYGIDKNTLEEDIVKELWRSMDAKEIAYSIVANGYFQFDPLIVDDSSGENIVIEGNRRLAAIKALSENKYRDLIPEDMAPLSKEIRKSFDELPVICKSRKDAWQFLGFKHVNGPAKWGSYAKAKYIADVHRKYKVSLSTIATSIGDTHNTVKRMYRGLLVLEQAAQFRVYRLEDAPRKRIDFSHLYTALEKEGFAKYLGIAEDNYEKANPVPASKKKQLGQVLGWLFGDESQNVPKVIKSQNPDLKNLSTILENPESVSILVKTNNLDEAFAATKPSDEVFAESLIEAKRYLLKCNERVSIISKAKNVETYTRISEEILELAETLKATLDRKKKSR